MAGPELRDEEFRALHRLSRAVDDLLEESLINRENLDQTFHRMFPPVLQLTGAKGIAMSTRNEELVDHVWHEGKFDRFAGSLLEENPDGVVRLGGDTFVSQALDVVGTKVGHIGLLFEGDHTEPREAGRLRHMLDEIAEQLDTVLASVHMAAEKHQILLHFNEHLANPVFEAGLDLAVASLSQRIRLPGLLVLFRDAVRSSVLHYRSYAYGALENDSARKPFPALEEAIARRGATLLGPDSTELKEVFSAERTAEAVLIAGASNQEPLGKLMLWAPYHGFSAFTMDIMRLLGTTLTQRLMDYNRERIHLSQFFSAEVIDELCRDPRYEARYLSPRDAEVGILFADINSFTRICELVLETPARIGRFVDRWSDGVVDILWKHGGVFDKMVGDCVIGLFGPPFFRSDARARAESAMRAAFEIQAFTEAMSQDTEICRIQEQLGLPGLGVAIGVNLAHTFCGLFGPNHSYTGFSSGMNQTARLQALGKFRQVLVMESVREAISQSADPFLGRLKYGPLVETPVKNVAHPLRYYFVERENP